MSGLKKDRKRFIVISLVLIFIPFIFLSILPMFMNLALSFYDYNILAKIHPFAGLQNFKALSEDSVFRISLKNSLVFLIIGVSLNLIIAFPVALALNKARILKGFFRTAYFLPTVASVVAVSLLWQYLYDPRVGPINLFLESIGMLSRPWLRDWNLALPAIAVLYVWRDLGYNIVILLAGLSNVPPIFYEVAEIDGANFLVKFFKITIPLLKPVIQFVVVMTSISYFKIFIPMHVITQGGPGNTTRSLVLYIYENAFLYLKMGYGAAMCTVLFIIILIFSLVQIKGLQTKWSY